MLRRRMLYNRARFVAEGSPALGGAPAASRALRPSGVPSDIAATFPIFKYEAATYEARQRAAATLAAAMAGTQPVALVAMSETPPPANDGLPMATTMTTAAPSANAAPPQGVTTSEGNAARRAEDQADEGQLKHVGDPLQGPYPPPPNNDDGVKPDGSDGQQSESDGDDDNTPQCSVCICDYEEGEVLRQLPCLHVFHQSCIDQWMTGHSSCPNCRRALWTGATDGAPGATGRRRCEDILT